jgi:hypothetical protein
MVVETGSWLAVPFAVCPLLGIFLWTAVTLLELHICIVKKLGQGSPDKTAYPHDIRNCGNEGTGESLVSISR